MLGWPQWTQMKLAINGDGCTGWCSASNGLNNLRESIGFGESYSQIVGAREQTATKCQDVLVT